MGDAAPFKRISNWAELREHLIQAYPSAKSSGDDSPITVTVALPERDAHVDVDVRPVDVSGNPWLEVVAVLGDARNVPTAAALGRNYRKPIGAFFVENNELGLRQLLPVEGLRDLDLDDTLEVIADLTAEFRQG